MRDPRLDKLADVLIRYCTRVKPGDLVSISADPIAMPLIEATYRAVVAAGGHPYWSPKSQTLAEVMLREGSEEQLRYVSPIEAHRAETIDVSIAFWAETNTRAFSGLDPARQAMAQSARRPTFKRFMERAAEGQLRWTGTMFPTDAAAQDAEMSLSEYEDFVFGAGMLHLDDPSAYWLKLHEQQAKVCDFLNARRRVRFRVPPADGHDGTDLTVDVDGSTWINCSGRENFPDGEVFAGPRGADGHVNYTFPAVYGGREVLGVRLAFKAGRVVDASATKNEDYLIKLLDQDEGARVMGEIAIGTNYAIRRFTRNTLFDEKIGGTFHAAVGAGYPESGSTNESGLHWDMVCELRPGQGRPGGTIEADGELFHKDGRFTHPGWPGNG